MTHDEAIRQLEDIDNDEHKSDEERQADGVEVLLQFIRSACPEGDRVVQAWRHIEQPFT